MRIKRFFRVFLVFVLSFTYLMALNVVPALASFGISQTSYDEEYISGDAGTNIIVGENVTLPNNTSITKLGFWISKNAGGSPNMSISYTVRDLATKNILVSEVALNGVNLTATPVYFEHEFANPVSSNGSGWIVASEHVNLQGAGVHALEFSRQSGNVKPDYFSYYWTFAGGWAGADTPDTAFIVTYREDSSPDEPTVTSWAGISQIVSGVILSADIAVGSANVTQFGVEYGTSTGNYTQTASTNTTISTNTPVQQLLPIATLTLGQTYYWRFYAINSFGTGYSIERDFILALENITVTTQYASVSQGFSGNSTVQFIVNVYSNPAIVVDNVSAHLGTTIGVWENDSDLSVSVLSDNSYLFSVSGDAFDQWILLPDTTYYYQGYAINDGISYYGSIHSFTTSNTSGIITLADYPTLIITDISDISSRYSSDLQPVFRITSKITSAIFEGSIYRKGFQFSLTTAGLMLLPPIGTISSQNEINPDGSFSVTLFLGTDILNLGWADGDAVYLWSFADNERGRGRSPIVDITADDLASVGEGGIDDDGTLTIEKAKGNLGLEGILGSWALMFGLIILTSIVFGIAFVEVQGVGKTAIGVSWLLAVVSIVGGFLFTGELGIFPVVIAVCAVAIVVITFAGNKLSGRGSDI